ncbi:hypothetical protein MHSWG343_10850 [Candidatus Mycoplasma haematohominis]|uniref:Uncharacterized protein n=1 Tax=Candidatus Mycoplasma haematohominis TaxID=1494318 RepID=A0A478FS86_9MOLU|nr:hypothetical protein MHSWG343_10850 [Candidatus Mycoplasma haemohominis]
MNQSQAASLAALGAVGAGSVGVGTAYATGAFDAKYLNFDDYVKNGGKYRYIGSTSEDTSSDPTAENIKKLIKEPATKNLYKDFLKGKIKDMSVSGVQTNDKPGNDDISKIGESGDSNDTITGKAASFVSKWCIEKKQSKPSSNDGKTKFKEKEITSAGEWSTFEKLCLEKLPN